jgi:hypothetical protein
MTLTRLASVRLLGLAASRSTILDAATKLPRSISNAKIMLMNNGGNVRPRFHESIPLRSSASKPFSTTSSASSPAPPKLGRDGSHFWLSRDQIDRYHRDGYIGLEGFLTEDEIKPIEAVYDKFMRREVEVPGKDFCDMSAMDFNLPFDQWNLINAMLPTTYYPALKNNIYERRAAHVCQQLFPDTNMGMDYDQLLAKKPSRKEAVFA